MIKIKQVAIYDEDDLELNKYKKNEIFQKVSRSDLGDNFLEFNKKKIAIKIDVERHEKKVIEGMPNILTNNKVIMQVELFSQIREKIINLLKEKNFLHFHTIERDLYFKNF